MSWLPASGPLGAFVARVVFAARATLSAPSPLVGEGRGGGEAAGLIGKGLADRLNDAFEVRRHLRVGKPKDFKSFGCKELVALGIFCLALSEIV